MRDHGIRLGYMRREQAAEMMTDLLKEQGLWEKGWRFNWMNRRNTYGLCRYGPKLVQLSLPFVDHNDEEKVLEVCRHEVAHALTPGAKHGWEWKMIARQLGVEDPRPCTFDAAELPPARYQATCPSCSKLYSKARPPKPSPAGRFYYCPPCFKARAHWKSDDRRAAAELTFVDSLASRVVSIPRTPVRQPVSASHSAPSVSVQTTGDSVPNAHTAPQVAKAMGIDPKKFRAWLRRWSLASNYQTGPGGAYMFNAEDVKAVVAAWNATH